MYQLRWNEAHCNRMNYESHSNHAHCTSQHSCGQMESLWGKRRSSELSEKLLFSTYRHSRKSVSKHDIKSTGILKKILDFFKSNFDLFFSFDKTYNIIFRRLVPFVLLMIWDNHPLSLTNAPCHYHCILTYCAVLLSQGFLPLGNSGCFPSGKASCDRVALTNLQCILFLLLLFFFFSVPIIYRTLTWSTGSLTCVYDLSVCLYT